MYDFYVTLIYQPFFNILVAIYAGLQKIPGLPHADMGIAVIIFTLFIRFILLPLTISASRSEKERRDIETELQEIKIRFSNDPVAEKRETRKLFLSNKRVIVSEALMFSIQTVIFLMLYRIFTKGLLGADLHLLYSFMPDVPTPYDLNFLGKFDLTHPNLTLNTIQSIIIFAVELLSTYTSPFPTSRKDMIRLQLILPIVSFFIFMTLPAGKKLFIITTLSFSFVFISIRALRHRFLKTLDAKPQ